jgi:tRNA(Ile)-lysidine synthase
MGNSRKSPRLNKANTKHKAAEAVAARFERALEAILTRVVASDGAIALAYSGGLDSSLLLRLLADSGGCHGRPLFAFHVHHGLSPNADLWLAHCAQQAADAGVAFDAKRVSLTEIAEHGIEQAARLARYRALGELCRRHRVAVLLTAHHQDDQAETVLLQLFRGAGPRGLSGMAARDDAHALLGPQVVLGRPLLDCRRSELEQAVAELGLPYIVDESNDDVRYRRNAVRRAILPLVEQHFPGASAAIARSARHAQAVQPLLEDLAAIDHARCADGDALSIDPLVRLNPARAANLLRYWLALRGAARLPGEAQLAQLREQICFAAPDAQPSLDLVGLRLQRHGGRLVVIAPVAGKPPGGTFCVRWQGERRIEVPEWRGALLFDEAGDGVPAEHLRRSELHLRPRLGRERLQLAGTRPSRSLKNLYQEAGIAAPLRAWLPLVYLDDALIFAAGVGMDARASATGEGIRMSWLPIESG